MADTALVRSESIVCWSRAWIRGDAGRVLELGGQSDEIACDLRLDEAVIAVAAPYPPSAKPVFVGHYWLSAHQPELLAENVACLDYSVAKNGFLCAYRWNGEQKLNNENFVWAGKE